jgi:hypothetical protein
MDATGCIFAPFGLRKKTNPMITGMAINTRAIKPRPILATEDGKVGGRLPWTCNEAIRAGASTAPTQTARPGQPHSRIETIVRIIAVDLFIVNLFHSVIRN